MQFTDKPRRKVLINITSLIDVLFLLLIFFMVSSTFLEQPGMKLELPETKSREHTRVEEFTLEITAQGQMFLNGEIVSLDELEGKFKDLLPKTEEKTLILKADKEVSHGQVVTVMDIAKLSGIKKLVVATKIGQGK